MKVKAREISCLRKIVVIMKAYIDPYRHQGHVRREI